MVVVTIELWPGGFRDGARLLGRMEIVNDCTGTATRGNYTVRLYRFDGKTVWRTARVEGFARVARGGYDLLQLALAAALRGRNGAPAHVALELDALSRTVAAHGDVSARVGGDVVSARELLGERLRGMRTVQPKPAAPESGADLDAATLDAYAAWREANPGADPWEALSRVEHDAWRAVTRAALARDGRARP